MSELLFKVANVDDATDFVVVRASWDVLALTMGARSMGYAVDRVEILAARETGIPTGAVEVLA
jgi:hypothetical protein